MYDWIPMEFDFEFVHDDGIRSRRYRVVTNDKNKNLFTTYLPDGVVGNNTYPLSALMDRMENYRGTINGMSLDEIMSERYGETDEIDISSLI